MYTARLLKPRIFSATLTQPYQGKGYADGFAQGKEAGWQEAQQELYFTTYGTLYKKHMLIETTGHDGFYAYAYRYADRMETLSVPYQKSAYTAPSSVFQGCSGLKTASLPQIQRIGQNFFSGCTSLEQVQLGNREYPLEVIGANAFRDCRALTRLELVGQLTGSIGLPDSPLLDEGSCQALVDSLVDQTHQSAPTLTLHGDVGRRMTQLQQATITAKNWILVY